MSHVTQTDYIFRGITLPAPMRESLDAYIEGGRPTGDFLRAVIENDLRMAVTHADDDNIRLISAYVGYLYNRAPVACWGYKGAWEQWIIRHGMELA